MRNHFNKRIYELLKANGCDELIAKQEASKTNKQRQQEQRTASSAFMKKLWDVCTTKEKQ